MLPILFQCWFKKFDFFCRLNYVITIVIIIIISSGILWFYRWQALVEFCCSVLKHWYQALDGWVYSLVVWYKRGFRRNHWSVWQDWHDITLILVAGRRWLQYYPWRWLYTYSTIEDDRYLSRRSEIPFQNQKLLWFLKWQKFDHGIGVTAVKEASFKKRT